MPRHDLGARSEQAEGFRRCLRLAVHLTSRPIWNIRAAAQRMICSMSAADSDSVNLKRGQVFPQERPQRRLHGGEQPSAMLQPVREAPLRLRRQRPHPV